MLQEHTFCNTKDHRLHADMPEVVLLGQFWADVFC